MLSLSLFAGGGGLDLGLHLAVPEARTVCYVEREAFAAGILATAMAEGSLAEAPIWSDVTTFDGRPWRGVVDCILGGFPCQDVSNAGKRQGLAGARSGLWREYARIIGEVRPRYVFIENVAALVNRGLETVLGDLASLGFHAEWEVLRASDVGSPHGRARVFVLAYADGAELRDESRWSRRKNRTCTTVARHAGSQLAYAECEGEQQQERLITNERRRVGNRGEALAGSVPWPPGPEDDSWSDYLRAYPFAEPAIRRGANGLANRWTDLERSETE